jgi:hypothetical protein
MKEYTVRFSVNGEHKALTVEAAGAAEAVWAVTESMGHVYKARPKVLSVSGGAPVRTHWVMARRRA